MDQRKNSGGGTVFRTGPIQRVKEKKTTKSVTEPAVLSFTTPEEPGNQDRGVSCS
jgi:hypothetical protein